MSKSVLQGAFVASIYFECTDSDPPRNASDCNCPEYETLLTCLESASKKLTCHELDVIYHAIDGVTLDGKTLKIENRFT